MENHKKEEQQINRIQANVIKRILLLPQSTPTETLYIETGLLDITTITNKNRMNYLNKRNDKPDTITTKIMLKNTKGGWKDTTDKITNTHNNNPTQAFRNKLLKSGETKTKTKYLINNTTWEPGKRKNYMNKLTRKEASTIFKARTRMLDIKENYRGKYTDNKCRACKQEPETQEHILESCTKIHDNHTTHVTKDEIFDEDITTLRNTTNKINHLITKLTEV